VYLVSCQNFPKLENQERMPIEANLNIKDALGSITSSRPVIFGLARNKTYKLSLSAEQFTSTTDSRMQIKLEIPQTIEIVSGQTDWIGTDKFKAMEVEIISNQTGEFKISVTAQNLETNFFTKVDIIVHIETTSDEVKQWLLQNN
jgi:hypothetical protein